MRGAYPSFLERRHREVIMKDVHASVIRAAGFLLAMSTIVRSQAAPATRAAIEWTAYGHDAGGTKHSPATQINRTNVKTLVPAWTYRTGDFALGEGMARDET